MSEGAQRGQVEEGLRLAGALLAAGTWPEQEQAARPYKPHRVAETARRALSPHRDHAAVQAAAALVNSGGPEALFAAAFTSEWPADLAPHLAGFEAEAGLGDLRERAQADWDGALADLTAVLDRARLGDRLAQQLGPNLLNLTIFPNLLYPGLAPVTILTARGWLLCLPPPPAWGASPPWRYSERPDEVLARASAALASAILERGLPEAHHALRPLAEVFGLAVAVLVLRATEGAEAADQFMLMEKRARKQPGLPRMVAALAGVHGLPASVEALARVAGEI